MRHDHWSTRLGRWRSSPTQCQSWILSRRSLVGHHEKSCSQLDGRHMAHHDSNLMFRSQQLSTVMALQSRNKLAPTEISPCKHSSPRIFFTAWNESQKQWVQPVAAACTLNWFQIRHKRSLWQWAWRELPSREICQASSACQKEQIIARWWFQMFLFSPLLGEDSQFD